MGCIHICGCSTWVISCSSILCYDFYWCKRLNLSILNYIFNRNILLWICGFYIKKDSEQFFNLYEVNKSFCEIQSTPGYALRAIKLSDIKFLIQGVLKKSYTVNSACRQAGAKVTVVVPKVRKVPIAIGITPQGMEPYHSPLPCFAASVGHRLTLATESRSGYAKAQGEIELVILINSLQGIKKG